MSMSIYHIKKSSNNNIPISSYRFGGEQHFAGFFKFFSKTSSTKMPITLNELTKSVLANILRMKIKYSTNYVILKQLRWRLNFRTKQLGSFKQKEFSLVKNCRSLFLTNYICIKNYFKKIIDIRLRIFFRLNLKI